MKREVSRRRAGVPFSDAVALRASVPMTRRRGRAAPPAAPDL